MARIAHLLLLLSLTLASLSCQTNAKEKTGVAQMPVRGFWLTNIDSEAMRSRAGLQAVVEDCVAYGFNTIYPVVWNGGYTLYPSEVMAQQFGTAIDPAFAGRDPLQELIELAHAEGIRVVAWFEFGFASAHGEADGGHILRARPHWAARDSSGGIVSKNNFQWMNAFDPEVQAFVLSLLKETVERYDIDGIQGDDRLPALPSLAGYDSLTVARYQAEHAGASPPENHKDTAWVDWRASLLNDFMGQLSTELRSLNPKLTLSFSPSIYPWSKYEYLQDWPTWVENGWVDELCPQVYRYDFEAYRREMDYIVQDLLKPAQQHLLAPGILLKVGDYVASDSLLQRKIAYNRSLGIAGEVFFFYEGIKRRPAFFEQLYR